MGDTLVSIIVPTRDRQELLPDLLTSLLAQTADGVDYEIIVVDNGSQDGTNLYLRDVQNRSHGVLRTLAEPRAGVSYARNAGIASSRGQILAFVDDDVRVRPGWLAAAARIFAREPNVHYVGGPVLPLWQSEPPNWLTREHWSPLAAVDYATEKFEVPTTRAVCLISANLFIRRGALDCVGWFDPTFRRCQDRELMLRLWAAGIKGLYAPDVAAATLVPAERLTRAYHRRWHTTHGAFLARMPLRERATNSNIVIESAAQGRRFLGVPLFVCRAVLEHVARYMLSSLALRFDEAFKHELHARAAVAFVLSSLRARPGAPRY
jgi:glucosyl-dolichyl phosphate glucuronosyltransferase